MRWGPEPWLRKRPLHRGLAQDVGIRRPRLALSKFNFCPLKQGERREIIIGSLRVQLPLSFYRGLVPGPMVYMVEGKLIEPNQKMMGWKQSEMKGCGDWLHSFGKKVNEAYALAMPKHAWAA